jgi:hypothetical protein
LWLAAEVRVGAASVCYSRATVVTERGNEPLPTASARLAWVVVLVALVWVPYLARWTLGLNSDAAVPYLMARHVLEGARPLYFWGNRYMGAIEAWGGAALLALGGRDRPWLVDLVPLAGYAAAAALLLRRAPPAERSARALLLVAAPPGLFVAIVRQGFSQGTPLWLTWAALAFLAPAHDPDPHRPRAFVRAAAACLVHAIGRFYIQTATLGVMALVPSLVDRLRRDWASAPPAERAATTVVRCAQLALVASGARLGDLPMRWAAPGDVAVFALERLENLGAKASLLGWSLEQLDPIHRFGRSIGGLEPYYAGTALRASWSEPPSATTLSAFVTAGLLGLAALGAGLVIRRFVRDLRDLRDLRDSRVPAASEAPAAGGVSPMYWVTLLAAVPAAFVVNRAAWDMGAARYLTSLWLPVVCCVALATTRLPRLARRALAAAWVVLVVAGHARMLGLERDVDRDLSEVAQDLDHHGVRAATGDYWLGYTLSARTRERIIVAPTEGSRFAPYVERFSEERKLAVLELTSSATGGSVLASRPDLYRRLEQRQFGIVTVTYYERRM